LRRNGQILVLVLLTLIGAGVAYSLRVLRVQREDFDRRQQQEMTAALQSLRTSLRTFREQHGRYPATLDELPNVPVDPVTHRKDWATTTEEVVQPNTDFTSGKTEGGKSVIVDVRSSAGGADADGKPWSAY
jgi:type II secretory pathway pseudopilin PulG